MARMRLNLALRLKKHRLKLRGTVVYGDASNLTIHDTVSFGGNVILYGTAPIDIGKDTIIGLNTIIHTSTHLFDNERYRDTRVDRPIRIGSNVWIGTGAIILPGIIIGDNAVVGAGAVVTKSVERSTVVAGVPARKMRKNVRHPHGNYAAVIKKGFIDEWL
jgi:maltose O-acetyltransferase